jgi:hypothetical protein
MKYGTESKLTTSKVLDRAAKYFGEGGLGLELASRDDCCVSFVGGGGHVTVTVTGGEKTTVDLETREWDYHVKKFMAEKLN